MSCSYRQTTLHTMKICVRTVAHSLHCPYRSRLTFHWSAPCEGFPRRMFVRNASCDVIRLPIDLIASTAACSSKSVFAYGLGCACFFPGKRGAVPNWWMLSLLPREPVMLLRSSRWAFSLSLSCSLARSLSLSHTLSLHPLPPRSSPPHAQNALSWRLPTMLPLPTVAGGPSQPWMKTAKSQTGRSAKNRRQSPNPSTKTGSFCTTGRNLSPPRR